MTLKVQDETGYAALNEVLKAEYVQGEDGRYYPDIEPTDDGWAYENIAALKRTKDEERRRREDWERKHGQLTAQLNGVDPDEIKSIPELKRQIAEMQNWTPDEKVQQRISELKGELENKVREVNDMRTQEVSARDSRIKRLVTGTHARRALSKLECLDPDLFVDRIERETMVDEKDNVWPVDPNGDRLQTKKKGATGDMTIEEFCTDLKAQHPRNFKGSQASGGSGDPNAAGGSGNNVQNSQFKKLPPTERLKQLRAAD